MFILDPRDYDTMREVGERFGGFVRFVAWEEDLPDGTKVPGCALACLAFAETGNPLDMYERNDSGQRYRLDSIERCARAGLTFPTADGLTRGIYTPINFPRVPIDEFFRVAGIERGTEYISLD
jgi:hypothetical protein